MDVLLELGKGGLRTRLVFQQGLFLDVGIHGDGDGDAEGVVSLRGGEEGHICLPWKMGVANTQGRQGPRSDDDFGACRACGAAELFSEVLLSTPATTTITSISYIAAGYSSRRCHSSRK